MRFGLRVYATEYTVSIRALAPEIEQRGFESLFVPEHTHMPVERASVYPGGEVRKEYAHLFDPFVALAFAAAATKTLKIGTGICLVAQRNPIVLAKVVASLDVLSGGRVLVGIGGGWNAEEMADHGVRFEDRWKVLREHIAAMQQLWSEDAPSFSGDFVNFPPCHSFPKPLQRPGPPLLMGGMGGPSRQRAVDLGMQWMPIHGREGVAEGIADLRRRAKEAGKETPAVTVWAVPADHASIAAYAEAGVERVVLSLPPTGSMSQAFEVLDQHAMLASKFQA